MYTNEGIYHRTISNTNKPNSLNPFTSWLNPSIWLFQLVKSTKPVRSHQTVHFEPIKWNHSKSRFLCGRYVNQFPSNFLKPLILVKIKPTKWQLMLIGLNRKQILRGACLRRRRTYIDSFYWKGIQFNNKQTYENKLCSFVAKLLKKIKL